MDNFFSEMLDCARFQADAERWRYARKFLSIDDIERWKEMVGHIPEEIESAKADAAIDAAREEGK